MTEHETDADSADAQPIPIDYEDFQSRDEHTLSTWKIAPVQLNRELSVNDMYSILDSVENLSWKSRGETYGDCRTETHYYRLDYDNNSYFFEHHRCGLERYGNSVAFAPATPDSLRWMIAMGVFETIVQKRKDDLSSGSNADDDGEGLLVTTPEEFLLSQKSEEVQRNHRSMKRTALEDFITTVEKLDATDFDGLRGAVEEYKQAIRNAQTL